MKAVLVIDMPENCLECPCHCRYDYSDCQAAGMTHSGNYLNKREDWCPLKSLPELKKCEPIKEGQTYHEWERRKDMAFGWNACLYKITE